MPVPPSSEAALAARAARRQVVADLLARNEVHSQPQLAALLEVEGIQASQATLSRDLRDLGARRTVAGYRLPESPRRVRRREERVVQAASPGRGFSRRGVRSVARTGAMLVLRTDPGQAEAVARRIDEADWHGVLGTIAGQDTVFAAMVSAAVARDIEARLAGGAAR